MNPNVLVPSATAGAIGASGFLGKRTIGLSGLASTAPPPGSAPRCILAAPPPPRHPAGRVRQPALWPALRTSHRLSVEPPVGHVAILGRTPAAHLECRHRGIGAVVRNSPP